MATTACFGRAGLCCVSLYSARGVPGSEVLWNESEENYDAAAAADDAGVKQG